MNTKIERKSNEVSQLIKTLTSDISPEEWQQIAVLALSKIAEGCKYLHKRVSDAEVFRLSIIKEEIDLLTDLVQNKNLSEDERIKYINRIGKLNDDLRKKWDMKKVTIGVALVGAVVLGAKFLFSGSKKDS